jgi:hypothetical protein
MFKWEIRVYKDKVCVKKFNLKINFYFDGKDILIHGVVFLKPVCLDFFAQINTKSAYNMVAMKYPTQLNFVDQA